MHALEQPIIQGQTCSPPRASDARHWPASLRLELTQKAGRTCVARNRHLGPLRLQRPFYPEASDCAHLYILHPPGGLVSGDDLHLEIDAGPATRSLVTTPSAGKVYHAASTGEIQRQSTHLKLAEGAQLEWLPQDNIVFNGARGELGLRVDLAPRSRFFGWEITCLGRAAGVRPFVEGALVQRLALYRDGSPWLLERMPLQATPELLESPWGLGGHPLFATAVATLDHLPAPAQRDLLVLARENLGDPGGGATLTRDLLIVRLLGHDSETVRQQLIALWGLLRPQLFGRAACPPRIWAT